MKKLTTLSILILVLTMFPVAAFADQASYDAKCKMCHGPDGKKLAKADLTSDAIQAKGEAELVQYLMTDAKHKSKVTDEATAKALVTFLKTMKK